MILKAWTGNMTSMKQDCMQQSLCGAPSSSTHVPFRCSSGGNILRQWRRRSDCKSEYHASRINRIITKVIEQDAQGIATVTEAELYTAAENELILVAGATGGIGQLVVAKLLERGYRVRALARTEEKGERIFGDKLPRGLQVVDGDCREEDFTRQAVLGADAIICCLGTTAFPSMRWSGGGPEDTDYLATGGLIASAPETLVRFILISSAGVDRQGQIPFNILNLFGVLSQKKKAEDKLKESGLAYTIVRPGRLTDGPYTSMDINTLLKATSGERQDVQVSKEDDLQDEASRIAVAEAIVQSLKLEGTINKTFSITSKKGDGPGQDPKKWDQLLSSIY